MASADAEKGALKGPAVEIRGATVHDQKWIDETTEAGVRALGWERPGPRPPEWDRPLAPIEQHQVAAKPPAEALPKTSPAWIRILRRKPVA